MLETILYASFTVNVLLLCVCVVLGSRMTDAEWEANTLGSAVSEMQEQNAQLNDTLKGVTTELTKKTQRIAELNTTLSAERERAQQKDASPWARDLPTSPRFELVQVPCEAVTLRAALNVPEHDLRDLTKVDLFRQLRAEVLKQAGEYVEVQKDYYDPCRIGERFVATLRVYQRRG